MTLKDAVRRGVPFRSEQGRRRTVRGDDLRALLISCCSGSSVTSAGIKIDGSDKRLITIVGGDDGVIDLSNLTPCCGNALPSLEITNCVIDGDLCVAGSYFAALRIVSSKVDSIDAAFSRIAGDLNLTGLSNVMTGIALRGAKVGGSLEVTDIEFAYPSATPCIGGSQINPSAKNPVLLDLNGIEAEVIRLRRFRLDLARTEAPHAPPPALFDLRSATCRAFDDDDARVWSGLGERSRWSVLLKGIALDAVDSSGGERRRAGAHSILRLGDDAALRSRRRRNMLMAFDRHVSGPRRYSKLVQAPTYSAQPHVVFAQAYSRAEERWIATEIATDQIKLRWASAVSVIRRRVREKAILGFGLCALLSAILVGLDQYSDIAAAIKLGDLAPLSWRRLLTSWLSVAVLAAGVLWYSHLLVSIVGHLFGAFFAFGLRPQRAVVAMGIYLFIGVVGVSAAAEEGALYPSTNIGGSQHTVERGQTRRTSRAIAALHQISAEGCNQASSNGIDQTIYALDVFIPVLDLRQECAFTFGSGHHAGWRLAKSLYELLGWVIVSLTLLSLSGVLRRDIES